MVRKTSLFGLGAWFLAAFAACGSDESPVAESPRELLDRVVEGSTDPVDLMLSSTGEVDALRGRIPLIEAEPAAAADSFLAEFGPLFGVTEPSTQLSPPEVRSTSDRTVVSYERVVDGRTVLGSSLRLHIDSSDGTLTAALAEMPPLDAGFAAAVISEGAAADAATEWIGASDLAVVSTTPTYVDPEILDVPGGRRAGFVVGFGQGEDVLVDVLVDGVEGTPIAVVERGHRARNRRVFDAAGGGDKLDMLLGPDAAWQQYEESGATVSSPSDEAADAFAILARVHDYWLFTFDRDNFDGVATTALDATVRFDAIPANAAHLDGRFFFATGMVGLDVAQHEFTHGVLASTVGVRNTGEPGALGEALSDFFAAALDREAPWTIGEGLNPPVANPPGVLRNLADPNDEFHPAHVDEMAELWSGGACATADDCGGVRTCSVDGACVAGCDRPTTCLAGTCEEVVDSCANDSGYVHENATVVGHALYLLAEGTVSSPLETVPGIGINKAEQLVYRTITAGYLGPASDFAQFASAMRFACADLALRELLGLPDGYGIGPRDCGVVANAFFTVGVLAEGDRDFDGILDSADACPDDFNPDHDASVCAASPDLGGSPDVGGTTDSGGNVRELAAIVQVNGRRVRNGEATVTPLTTSTYVALVTADGDVISPAWHTNDDGVYCNAIHIDAVELWVFSRDFQSQTIDLAGHTGFASFEVTLEELDLDAPSCSNGSWNRGERFPDCEGACPDQCDYAPDGLDSPHFECNADGTRVR